MSERWNGVSLLNKQLQLSGVTHTLQDKEQCILNLQNSAFQLLCVTGTERLCSLPIMPSCSSKQQ